MKTSTILLAFCALAVTSALGADLDPIVMAAAEKCIKQTGADPEILKHMEDPVSADDDEKTKCFGACIMKSLGLMAEGGALNIAVIKATAPMNLPNRDKLIAILDICANEKGPNDCETAHAVAMCMEKNGARGLL